MITTIHTTKKTKNLLTGTGTYDERINKLIDEVQDIMPVMEIDDTPKTSIRVHEDTINKLKSYALTTSESYENIILRMLIAKNLNTTID